MVSNSKSLISSGVRFFELFSQDLTKCIELVIHLFEIMDIKSSVSSPTAHPTACCRRQHLIGTAKCLSMKKFIVSRLPLVSSLSS